MQKSINFFAEKSRTPTSQHAMDTLPSQPSVAFACTRVGRVPPEHDSGYCLTLHTKSRMINVSYVSSPWVRGSCQGVLRLCSSGTNPVNAFTDNYACCEQLVATSGCRSHYPGSRHVRGYIVYVPRGPSSTHHADDTLIQHRLKTHLFHKSFPP